MSLTVEKCLQAWTNFLRQMNVKADIVFFGDSLTYYGDFSSVFTGKVVSNLGLRGDTIKGMIERVEQVKLLEPKVVYLMAGINDVGGVSANDFCCLYTILVEILLQLDSIESLVIQSILPVNTERFKISCDNRQIRACNSRISEIAHEHGLRYIDLYSLYDKEGQLPQSLTKDGLHLNADAYQIWYNSL